MAYTYNNVQATANKILGLKNDWNTATAAGDNEKAKQIAANAQNYYKQLRDSGNEAMAQKLTDSNYEQSKKYINDYFAAQGRSAIRPYFYNLGKKYGLSQSDIDKDLSFNETTGEVTFGGKNMGKPEAISSEGVSYWNTDTLDNAFSDYVSRTGTARSKSSYVDQENENWSNKFNQTWDENLSDRDVVNKDIDELKSTINGNPFSTEEAKAILGKYDLSAIQGRNNQLASGAASNGGNIDSYSAANAMRQQAALYSMGQQAVLDAHNSKVGNLKDAVSLRSDNAQSKIDNARQLLSDLGVQIDRTFNQDETAKNNEVDRSETVKNGDVARKQAIAETTGYVPKEWSYANNMFFNSDGTLINENADYKSIIEQAVARGDSETAKQARQARAYKIFSNYDKYGQFDDGDYSAFTPQQTEAARVTDAQLKNSMDLANITAQNQTDLANINADTEKTVAETNANATKYNSDNSLAATKYQTDANLEATKYQTDAEKWAYENGYKNVYSSSNANNPVLSDSKVKDWINFFNEMSQDWHGEDAIVSDNGNYKIQNDEEYIAYTILNDATIDDRQREYLINKFNVSVSAVNKAYEDMKKNQLN